MKQIRRLPGQEETLDEAANTRPRRKKFRKMKIKFDHMMNESNELYMEEQRAIQTAKRLALENELAYLSFDKDQI